MLICTYKLSDEFVELLCHPLEGINITYRLFWLLVVISVVEILAADKAFAWGEVLEIA